MFDSLMQVGLYLLYLIPVFGVYAYFRIFIDRYAVALKHTQKNFQGRMMDEADRRRTRANLEQMSKDMDIDVEQDEDVDIRNMDPSERIIYCLEKGLILNLSIPINEIKVGQVLGLDAVNANGDVLLSRGSYITPDTTQQLRKLNIAEVSVMFHPDHPKAKTLLKN